VAENAARPPVAIRIVRPYQTEEEFLTSELETVGKTSIILIGAHPRPTGVILRFEVTLASGATILRGEGRVLGHKESAFRGQPGLSLRFTRLDPKSKALIDRAAAMREARLSAASVPPPAPAVEAAAAIPEPPPPPAPPPPPSEPASDPALQAALTAASPAPPSVAEVAEAVEDMPTHVETRESSPLLVAPLSEREPEREPERAPERAPEQEPVPAPVARSASGGARTMAAPPDREALLTRLRQRAAGLSREQVDTLLAGART
jgi:hypothetical protein